MQLRDAFIKLAKESSKSDSVNELFHYTNSEGLLGIIKNGEFWATHHKFHTDETEIKYGIELLKSKMLEYSENETDKTKKEVIRDFCKRAHVVSNYAQHILDYYTVSFSSDNASKLLWKEYGDKGKGYTLSYNIDDFDVQSTGLDIEKFSNYDIKSILIKICYEEEQEKIIRAFYELIKSDIAEETNADLMDKYCKWYYSLPVSFKNPFYEFENEWRILYKTSQLSKDKISFRSKKDENIPIPYIKIEVIPIIKITVGYNNDFEKSRKSLALMFKQNNMIPPPIEHSVIHKVT